MKKRGGDEMMNIAINRRPMDIEELKNVVRRYNDLSNVEKDILENCVLEIYSLFDLDPNQYQFDFRFHKRQ